MRGNDPGRAKVGDAARTAVRTCIGCRGKDERSALLRVVATPTAASGAGLALVLDHRRTMSGRGCWLHPDLACLDTAARRHAFARALRVQGPLDAGGLRAAFQELLSSQHEETESGFDADEHPMSTQK